MLRWVLSGLKGCHFKLAANVRWSLEAKWVAFFFFGGAPDETPTTHKTTISCEFSQGPRPLGCTSPFTAHFSGLSLFSNPIFAFLECVSRKIFPLLLQHFFNAAPKTGACQFSGHAYVFPLFQANKTNVTYKILCPPENWVKKLFFYIQYFFSSAFVILAQNWINMHSFSFGTNYTLSHNFFLILFLSVFGK